MFKKILISGLIAIGLLSGAIVRGVIASGNSVQHKTRGRGRGFRKKGGEQERPRKTMEPWSGLNPQPLPPGKYYRGRGHRRRHRRHPN
jgi:hypothetical protein